MLTVVYSETGQEEAARNQFQEVMKTSPQFSLEALRERLPFKDPEMFESALDALRKAGLN